MPLATIFGLIVLVAGLVTAAFAAMASPRNRLFGPGAAAAGTAVLAALLFFAGSVNSVPVRNYGIVTEFGRPTGETTGAGLQLVAPWQNVEDWNAKANDYDKRGGVGCKLGDKGFPGIKVRIANGSDACVESMIRWTAKNDEKVASAQWQVNRDFDVFREKRIEPYLDTAVAEVFATFDPLATVNAETAAIDISVARYGTPVQKAIERLVGTEVTVDGVTLVRVNLDPKTQENIDRYSQAIMQQRLLAQEQANTKLSNEITASKAQRDRVIWCLEIAQEKGGEPGLCLGSVGGVILNKGK